MKHVALALLCLLASFARAEELPFGLATPNDLRGMYRAALCERADMTPELCARTLRTYAGETPASPPPPADPSRYRLVFIPGFLAECFPSIHSFEDVIASATARGYAAELFAGGGRDGVRENAQALWDRVNDIPEDGRRIVLIGHSKGAAEVLQLLVDQEKLQSRVAAVLSVAGALQGSSVADAFAPAESILRWLPAGDCVPGKGKGRPVHDLTTTERAKWWTTSDGRKRTLPRPLYSLVALPDLDLLSPVMIGPFAISSRYSRDNDGLLLVQDQVVTSGHLLGVINADHLTIGIPFPGPQWVFTFRDVPSFPRPQVILAAIDVIAAND